jgi:hypothetical protein
MTQSQKGESSEKKISGTLQRFPSDSLPDYSMCHDGKPSWQGKKTRRSGTILGNHKDLGIIYLPITHSEKTS